MEPLVRKESYMAQTSEALENFRAEAKSWLAENFPPSLAGQAGAVLRTESVDPKRMTRPTESVTSARRLPSYLSEIRLP